MLCPFLATENGIGECQRAKCARWDKERQQCVDLSINENLGELWRAQDNLARSINQGVLLEHPQFPFK